MIEAKLLYHARCDVCREPFGRKHSTKMFKLRTYEECDETSFYIDDNCSHIHYDGPYVCPTCTEKQCAPVNGCLDQSLHDNLIDMGIKKQKGEE